MPRGIYTRTSSSWNKGLSSWNKGLTAETDTRVANYGKSGSATKKGKLRVPREIRTCVCGKTFKCKVTATQKFCSRSCYCLDKLGKKCKPHTQEHIDKIAKANTGKKRTQAFKDKMRKIRLKRKEKLGYINSPETRKKMREAMRVESDKSPNEPEKFLIKLLDKLFPNEYKFVGNRKFWIEDYNPDFVNTNGQKKLIEHQGDYWHANPDFCKTTGTKFVQGVPVEDIRRHDKERLDILNSYGYQTLIIWEHELKDISNLESRLVEFHNS